MPPRSPKSSTESSTGARTGLGTAPVLYFVQAEDVAIKIGITFNISDRLKTLQVGCPLEIRLLGIIPEDAADLEGSLHADWAAHRIRGEWFRPVAEILAYVAAHAVDYDRWATDEVYHAMSAAYAPPPPTKGGPKAILAAYKAARGIT